MVELQTSIGIGTGDLSLAADREVRRLLKSAKGSRNRALILGLKKLVDMELITADELKSITKIFNIGFKASKGHTPPEEAHLMCRRIADEMLASGQHSPTALALAYAETNSYVSVEEEDGNPIVVYKKKPESWESTLTGAGAIIGGILGGGGGGAALGGAIGKVVGKIVDACTEE
jgi:hypothetical protein